jgi:predicted anti-sigma-YlaC factor YlaD
MRSPRPQLCDRARQWASLRADGELSELEGALLDAHLGRCAACEEFVADLGAITTALRSVALEPPSRQVVVARVPRTRRVRVLQTAVAAALVIVAAGLGSVLNLASRSSSDRPAQTALRHTSMVAVVDSADELRRLRRAVLMESGKTIPRNLAIPGESV